MKLPKGSSFWLRKYITHLDIKHLDTYSKRIDHHLISCFLFISISILQCIIDIKYLCT